mgnify:CR=1 FL=1
MRYDVRTLTVGGAGRYASRTTRARAAMEDISAFLAKTVLFSVLPPAALPAIAQVATRVALAKGEALFTAGTAGDAVYLVRSGLLQVVSSPDARESSARRGRPRRARRRDGGPDGRAARGAAAIAVVESVLYALPGDLVRTLFQAHPEPVGASQPWAHAESAESVAGGARGVRTCALVGAGTGAASLASVDARARRGARDARGGIRSPCSIACRPPRMTAPSDAALPGDSPRSRRRSAVS